MADNILKARVRHAYKTDAEWATANPILLKGEIAYSSDRRQTKTGDGTAHWADLEYDKAMPAGSYLPTSGGTMTGTANITWSDSGNFSNKNVNVTFPVKRGGLQWNGQSDGISLYAEETGNDNLDLVLKFTDDNSNGLSIRNKSGSEVSRIDANGNFTGKAKTAGTADKANSVEWSNVANKPTIGNGTITIKQAGTTKATFTMNQTGATTVELTDNNTWRGVQDNLTSTATDQSLSANQGKILNDRTYQMRSIQIGATTDFNTITSPGCYKVQMSAWGDTTKYNSPNSYDKNLYSFGLLTVNRALSDSENRIVQVYYPHIGSNVTTGVIMTRMYNGSAWQAWLPITKGMTWANILNKPSTFTPAAHNHDSSYLKLSGGTVTGNTAFNKGTASTSVTTGTVTVNGGIGVTGRTSTTEVAIADKVILKYDTANSCLNFTFL